MHLKHTALTSSSEEKADTFFADLLGLTKSEPKSRPLGLSRAIFNVDSELVMINYQDENTHFEIIIPTLCGSGFPAAIRVSSEPAVIAVGKPLPRQKPNLPLHAQRGSRPGGPLLKRRVLALDATSGPPQLGLQHIKIMLSRQGDHIEGVGCLLDNDGIFMGDIKPFLPVKGQHDIGGLFFKLEPDPYRIRDNQRTVGQGKGADRCDNDSGNIRMDDRTAGAQ